jgi:transposase
MERRRFGREFKLEAVKLVRERGVTVAQAARDLDLHENVLARFTNQVRHRLCPGSPWEQNTITSRLRSDAAYAA